MNEYRHRWQGPHKGAKIVGMVIVGLIAAAFFALIFGYFAMLLWNWLMPYLFSLKQITYWQAFGVILLAHLLFGSHRMSGYKARGTMQRRRYYEDENEYMKRDWNTWKYYDEWWDRQGKKAFDEYVGTRREHRANAQDNAGSSEDHGEVKG